MSEGTTPNQNGDDVVEQLGRIRMRGIGLLVAMFAAGLMGGLGIAHLHMLFMHRERPRMMSPGHLPPVFERLDLSADQRNRIVAILDAARPQTDSVMRIMMPRLHEIEVGVHARIDSVLTPEQREKLAREQPMPLGRPRFGPGFPGGPPPGGFPPGGEPRPRPPTP